MKQSSTEVHEHHLSDIGTLSSHIWTSYKRMLMSEVSVQRGLALTDDLKLAFICGTLLLLLLSQ